MRRKPNKRGLPPSRPENRENRDDAPEGESGEGGVSRYQESAGSSPGTQGRPQGRSRQGQGNRPRQDAQQQGRDGGEMHPPRPRRRHPGEGARRGELPVELVAYGQDETDLSSELRVGLYDLPAQEVGEDPFGDDLFSDLAVGYRPDAAANHLYGVHVRWGVPPRLSDFHSDVGPLQPGDTVLVETEKGQFFGEVASDSRLVTRGRNEHPRRVLQLASAQDRQQYEQHRKLANEAFSFAGTRVKQLNLDMKLFYVFVLSSGDKMMFYFTSDTRVDFRRLVRDLAARFSMRIEMRQMGPRDDSRITGGLGVCGKELCCAAHLNRFLPVSIRMAKDQNLVLNPQSVSGQCNRLKCCLAYEQEFYQELRRGMPKLGKKIDTPQGYGRVLDVNLLTGQIRVSLDDGPMVTFSREDILGMQTAAGQAEADSDPSPAPEPEPEE